MQKENGIEKRKRRTEEKKERKYGKKKSKIEMAKKLLAMNLTVEQIIEVTELTKEEIEKLKK